MREKSIGLLEQYEIACIRPGRYPELLHLKKSKKIKYMILLLLFLVFLEVGIPFAAWDYSVGGLGHFITEGIPTFSISKEGLKTKDKVDTELAGFIHVQIDANKKQFTMQDITEKYPVEFLVSGHNFMVKTLNPMTQFYDLQEVDFSKLGEIHVNNETLLALKPLVYLTAVLTFVFSLIAKAVWYIICALTYGLIARGMVRTVEGRTVTSGQAFEIGLFAKTIFAILESITVCIDSLISASMLFTVVRIFFTMGLIRRAEVAVLGESIKKEGV